MEGAVGSVRFQDVTCCGSTAGFGVGEHPRCRTGANERQRGGLLTVRFWIFNPGTLPLFMPQQARDDR